MLKLLSKIKCAGFSLSEMLVTMGIIGLTAAITIQVIDTNTKEANYQAGYLEAYALLEDAQAKHYVNNNQYFDTASEFSDFVNDNFQVAKIDATVKTPNTTCWHDSGDINDSDGNPAADVYNVACAQLLNGMYIASGADPTTEFMVDINGPKNPNKFCSDIFLLHWDATDRKFEGNPALSVEDDCAMQRLNSTYDKATTLAQP